LHIPVIGLAAVRAGRTFARIAGVTLLLVSACLAIEKTPPNFSGTWKIDRGRSTGPSAPKAPSEVVITQSGDAVTFEYFFGESRSGSETFVADGTERNRYSTRIERAYSRAQWGKDALLINTRHFLDALGYQFYAEADGWVVSHDRETLTNRLSDGSVVVYEKRGPARDETTPAAGMEGIKEFHAMGVISGSGPCSDAGFGGTLRGELIGAGKVTFCGSPAQRPQAGSCATQSGTLTFTEEDGSSSLQMTVIGQYCTSQRGGTFLGTYEVDKNSVTGKFARQILGGSGKLEYSNTSKTISLVGVLLGN